MKELDNRIVVYLLSKIMREIKLYDLGLYQQLIKC